MACGSTLDIFYGYRYYRFNIMTLITIVCPVSKKDQGAVFPGVPFFLSILFLEEISPTAKGLNIYQTVNQHKKNPHHVISSQCFSILFRQDNAIHRIRTTCLRTACGVRSQSNNYLIYSLSVVNYRAVCVIRRNFIHTSHNTPVNRPALLGIVPRRRRHEPWVWREEECPSLLVKHRQGPALHPIPNGIRQRAPSYNGNQSFVLV